MNFQEILDTKVDEIERPPLPPLGTYRAVITGVPVLGERSSEKGEWDTIDFNLQAVEGVVVDEDELAQFGLQNVKLRYGFMFDRQDAVKQEQSKFRFRTFCEHTLKLDIAGKSLKEMLNDCTGAELQVVVKYRADPSNPEIQYAEVGKVAPVE